MLNNVVETMMNYVDGLTLLFEQPQIASLLNCLWSKKCFNEQVYTVSIAGTFTENLGESGTYRYR